MTKEQIEKELAAVTAEWERAKANFFQIDGVKNYLTAKLAALNAPKDETPNDGSSVHPD